MKTEEAILAGGCFWGMQELIRNLKGVTNTEVGYTGGANTNPSYRNHPRHAEAIKITFTPDEISYRKLLEFFFQIHDPTTLNRQGNDVGSSYRSVIFYNSKEQLSIANKLIREIDLSGVWPNPLVTEVKPAVSFWPAEFEHQDYLQRFPEGYTCHYIRPSWVLAS